jgi:hypothetical protein
LIELVEIPLLDNRQARPSSALIELVEIPGANSVSTGSIADRLDHRPREAG